MAKPRISSMSICLLMAVAGCTACGGSGNNVKNPDQNGTDGAAKSATNDQSLGPFEEIALQGMIFVPTALGRPSLGLKVNAKRKTTLAKQRKRFKSAKGVRKSTEAAILATMLWDAARNEKKEPKAKKLREEARDALAEAFKAGGDKTKEYVLVMLANAELYLGNSDAAAKVYEALLKTYPQSKRANTAKTWLAYIHLQAGRNAEAAKVIDGWTVQTVGNDALAAYVLAWVKWRALDWPAAHQAMLAAAQNWQGATGRQVMYTDLMLFTARLGTELTAAQEMLTKLAGGKQDLLYGWLYKLHEAYLYAGNYRSANALLDQLASGKVIDQVPPNDLVAFRFKQADYNFRLNDPAASATAAIAAYDALTPCADKCSAADKEAVTNGLAQLASVYHTVFATSLDERYYEAAKQLYTKYVGIDPARPDKDKFSGYESQLEQAKKNTAKSQGKHDPKVLNKMILVRREAVNACYEKFLQANPALTGTVKLTLNVDQTGAVTGAVTDPTKGKEAMPAVAGCVEQMARKWTFPSRSTTGTTAMVIPYSFSKKADAAAGGVAASGK